MKKRKSNDGKFAFMIVCICFLVILAGSGCSSIMSTGAKVSDEALIGAKAVICQGASIGSIRRMYGTPEGAKIWANLCSANADFTPIAVSN